MGSDPEPLYCLFRGGDLNTQNFGPAPNLRLESASYVVLHLPKRDLKRPQWLSNHGKNGRGWHRAVVVSIVQYRIEFSDIEKSDFSIYPQT